MTEFIQICLQPVNLPFTVLLGLVFAYWSLFVLGTVGLDMLDFDLDLDTDVDLDVDVSLDAADADFEVDTGSGDGHGSGHATGGSFLFSALRFINLGEVPTMIVASVLIFCMWAGNLMANHYFNQPFRTLVALGLLIPCFVAAVFSTKILTLPLRAVFRRANEGVAKPTQILGKRCKIASRQVTTAYGQAELVQEEEGAAPISINVRTKDGQTLSRGMEALIVDHDEEKDTYLIVPFELGVN